ncbi:MAG: hypothetical protein R6U58_07385 [Bacteroidales bacterium]
MDNQIRAAIITFLAFTILAGISCKTAITDEETAPVKIYKENPFYWEYKGEPVLLLGGSGEDNLFNHPDGLAEHLDILRDSGGNYIRNTMSSRNPGNPWPHKIRQDGLYDLDEWDEEYWIRFENLLTLTLERDIIVQIEIWDPWDYFMTEAPIGYGPGNVGWESCPYNPVLNVNYTADESGLATEIDYYSGNRPSDHLFFHTVPELKDIPLIRKYQEAFVDKLLSISLDYPNILYCMNNEIGEPAEWGEYWAGFIRNRAEEAGKEVFLADMRRNSDFTSEEQIRLLHDRVHYDFFEISQNTANNGQKHYDQIISIRDQVIEQPKPLNNVKIYGGRIGSWTTSVEEGTRRFWRNIFGGLASSRFHREGPSPLFFGAGLSDIAQTHIRSMRMLTDKMDVFSSLPSNHLLGNREPNEAYCFAEEGRHYALYFPDGGEVMLDLSAYEGEPELRWMNILESAWLKSETIRGGVQVIITTPGPGQWAALISYDPVQMQR